MAGDHRARLARMRAREEAESRMKQARPMFTVSGRAVWPLDPDPATIELDDIAHALSQLCRYNGHTRRFYSVAEHCVLVSRAVPREDALWGLLHDASEAYFGDLIRPVKPFVEGFAAREAAMMRAVCARFGLPTLEPASVRRADALIIHDEALALLPPLPEPWSLTQGPKLGVLVSGWAPPAAKLRFLERFAEVAG